MRPGQIAETTRACSCQLDIFNVQEIPGYKPKRKLQEGEIVMLLRRVVNKKIYWRVRTTENKLYTVLESDLKC